MGRKARKAVPQRWDREVYRRPFYAFAGSFWVAALVWTARDDPHWLAKFHPWWSYWVMLAVAVWMAVDGWIGVYDVVRRAWTGR